MFTLQSGFGFKFFISGPQTEINSGPCQMVVKKRNPINKCLKENELSWAVVYTVKNVYW